MSTQPRLSTGLILNSRYRIVKLLGEGGFGAVYRAWDTSLNIACAVKESFESSPEASRQFKNEAIILANLKHPNLPRVTDHFVVPNQGQYLVMDYVGGEDLQEKIDQASAPLPETEVVKWLTQICEALAYLHTQTPPIIHRDIKPANIKITPQGKALLVDFGIAKIYNPQTKTTMAAQAVSPGYSPLEQYGRGITDARSDLYALGATLYAALTKEVPPESTQRTFSDPLIPPLQLNPRLSPHITPTILRAMQVNPVNRFQSATEFAHALTQKSSVMVIGSAPVIAPTIVAPISTTPVPTTGQNQNQWLWAFIAFGVIALCLIIGVTSLIANNLLVRTTSTPAFVAVATSTTFISPPTETRQVTTAPTTPPRVTVTSIPSLTPSLTPTQRRSSTSTIGYSIGDGNDARVVFISPDGSNRHLLPNQPAASAVPNFSPDGQRLVFVSWVSGDPQLYVANMDGSDLTQVTATSKNYDAAWSPDSRQLAFISERDGSPNIYVLNLATQSTRRITSFNGYDGDPTWSPDGREIAFERKLGNRWDIFIVTVATGSTRQISSGGDSNNTPAWSPDGTRIAFERSSNNSWGIYSMNPDGSGMRSLATTGNINYRPAWSPDSKQIAWRSNRSGSEEIWTMNADGSNQKQLTFEGGAFDPGWGGR
jgi:Tol biopolymer transport system component